MQEDIYLLNHGDTLRPALYHFERSYDLASQISCLVSFNHNQALAPSLILVWEDSILGIGPLRFPFSSEDIQHIPALKL